MIMIDSIYRTHLKRPLDLLLSLIALIVLFPLFIVVAILIKMNLGSPIIFAQRRPGINEKIFMLYKFRTMNNKYNEKGELLPDKVRLTKLGEFLRNTSIDELPELFNIIKGDMSLVGPRPLAVQYLPYYTEFERKRHSVLPGLTGLAQINGRNSLCWEEKFKYDVEYTMNVSFLLDIKIIIKTIVIILKRNNIGLRGLNAPEDFDKYRQTHTF